MSEISPIGLVGNIVGGVIKSPFIAVGAATSGFTRGIGEISKGSEITPLDLSWDYDWGKNLSNLISNPIRNFFANGFWSLGEQKIAEYWGAIFKVGSFSEMGTAIKAFGTQLTGLSARGSVLFGANILAGGLAVIEGARLMFSAYKKFSELSKGFRPLGERVDNRYLHLAHAGFGAGVFAGGLLMFTPFGLFGAALAATSAIGAVCIGVYKNIGHGDNWLTRPSTAPYPLSALFNVFKNDFFASY